MKEKTNFILKDTLLSLIIISENDSDIILESLTSIKGSLSVIGVSYEILIIDNHSEDNTLEQIKKFYHYSPHIRVIVLSRKYEREIAITAGLDNCIGDYAILFNLYTDPPNILPKLFQRLIDGDDIITGNYTDQIPQAGLFSIIFLWLINKISDHGFNYRRNYSMALNRKAINSIIRTRRRNRNFGYLNSLIGYKKTEIKYTSIRKYNYKFKKEGFFDLFFNVTDIIISNSFKPIRILTFLGMLASISYLLYVFAICILVLVFKMHNIAPQGWISISTVLGGMFFLLFSLLTLISEYIIRILNESRDEPFYFIGQEIDMSIVLASNMLNVT